MKCEKNPIVKKILNIQFIGKSWQTWLVPPNGIKKPINKQQTEK